MTFSPLTAIGKIAATQPTSIAVFERHHLDYCCNGRQSLELACQNQGLDPRQVLDEILSLPESNHGEATAEAIDWTQRSLTELVDHLLKTHHAYLHENMGKVAKLAETVAKVHGDRHLELLEVQRVFAKFMAEMGPHMRKEELVLFPNIVRLENEGASMPLMQPIAVMEAEHDEAGRDLMKLRALTAGYQVPPDACTSYTMLMNLLAEMEKDTLVHVHKENNILFPRTLAAPDV